MDEQKQLPIPVPDDFPVQWEDPTDEEQFWTRDRMHQPNQITVLEFEIGHMVEEGFRKAFDHFGMPIINQSRRINTYTFGSSQPALPPDEMAVRGAAMEATMRDVVASLGILWEERYLPEIQAHLAYWTGFDLAGATMDDLIAHLDESLSRFERVWEVHFLIAIPMRVPMSLFEEMYGELFETDDPFAAYSLLEGLPNLTLESGTALWRLSRAALASESVRSALSLSETEAALAALAESEDGRAFAAEFDRYLQKFGERSGGMSIAAPSWIEDPTPVLVNLRDYMAQPDRDLLAEMEATVVRREGAVAQARERLLGYPEAVVQQFEFLLTKAQVSTVLTEDHGYWIDYRCTHQLRMVLMALAQRFVAVGIIGNADDIFHLTLDEIRAAGSDLSGTDYQAQVVARADEMVRWAHVKPPDALGTPTPGGPPPDSPVSRMMGKMFGTPVQPSGDPDIIRGHAGSPGLVTGRARIIRSIGQAAILEPGDILVAETTSPPWTPLFGTVAAVVTDTGGILSHCAVVAREYGIPAVVGTGIASSTIADGQIVEVDGDAGTVRIIVDGTSETIAV